MKYSLGLVDVDSDCWLNGNESYKSVYVANSPFPIPLAGDRVSGADGDYEVVRRMFFYEQDRQMEIEATSVVHLFCKKILETEDLGATQS